MPLPARKHLLPEVVATWNRGKRPINVYSRFQKSVKSYHSHLGPVGAIWLRLIVTSVHNSFQAYNLSRTERFLKSDECNSFQNFQHFWKRPLPFRQFSHLLANDLIVDGRGLTLCVRREIRQHQTTKRLERIFFF